MPLCIATVGPRTYVSPSEQLLLDQPGVSSELNRAALAEHILRSGTRPHETCRRAIQRIGGGHVWHRRRDGTERTSRYWHLPRSAADIDWLNHEAACELPSRLENAVAPRIGLGSTTILLSGGLDSISVATVAADLAQRGRAGLPTAQGLIFPEPAPSEADVQQAVATKLDIELQLSHFGELIGEQSVLAAALELNSEAPAPMRSLWAPAYVTLLRRAAARHTPFVITGDGADEWLGVDRRYVATLLRHGDIAGAVRLARTFANSYDETRSLRTLSSALWGDGVRVAGRACVKTLSRRLGARRRAQLHRAVRAQVRSRPAWLAPDPTLRSELESRTAEAFEDDLDLSPFYPAQLVDMLDSAETAARLDEQQFIAGRAGVTKVAPYWDPRLIDWLIRIKPEVLNRGGRTKALVRELVHARFPQLDLANQQKVSAESFYRRCALDGLPQVWRQLDGFTALGDLGVVEPKAAGELMEQNIDTPDGTNGRYVVDLLMAEKWVRSQ